MYNDPSKRKGKCTACVLHKGGRVYYFRHLYYQADAGRHEQCPSLPIDRSRRMLASFMRVWCTSTHRSPPLPCASLPCYASSFSSSSGGVYLSRPRPQSMNQGQTQATRHHQTLSLRRLDPRLVFILAAAANHGLRGTISAFPAS